MCGEATLRHIASRYVARSKGDVSLEQARQARSMCAAAFLAHGLVEGVLIASSARRRTHSCVERSVSKGMRMHTHTHTHDIYFEASA